MCSPDDLGIISDTAVKRASIQRLLGESDEQLPR